MTDLIKKFIDHFHQNPQYIFFSPGRVNLIGEHIDYNGGKVMPCAITLGTFLAVSKNIDKVFRFQSLDFPESAELHLQQSYSKTGKAWYNYPLGVIHEILNQEHSVSGLNMLFSGNLPIGAGLSSSASIEVLMAYSLNKMFQLNISQKDITLISKKTENEFIGVNCGVMDQFAVTFGEKNKAILLDCDTLEYELLPFDIGENVLAIINTNKKRTLADSKYNERFAECGAALKLIKKGVQVKNLCELEMENFESYRNLIGNPILIKRTQHVISENFRVKKAAQVLKEKNLTEFGKLMFDSHQSLNDLYEVSGIELDTIVDFCKKYKGCLGARMTGAGFGGCAIALVKKEKFDEFKSGITSYYKNKIGYEPDVFACAISDGVKEVSIHF